MNRIAILKGRTLMSVALATGLCACGTRASAADPSTNYAALGRDVQILGKVLEAATAPEGEIPRWEYRGSHVEGLYLAGQGMVFEIHLAGTPFAHALVAAPLPPLPPLPLVDPTGEGVPFGAEDILGDTGQMSLAVDEAMSSAQEAMHVFGHGTGIDPQTRDLLRALRESQRKAAQDYRDRQLAYVDALRADSKLSQAERDKLRTGAEQARQDFETAQQQLRAETESLRADQKQKWLVRVQHAEQQLLDALCSYAGSTRRLATDEHVSLVLDNATGEDDPRRRIWVIRKSDLDACASGKQSGDYLQKQALSYLL